MIQKVAFIGLGIMGSRMALNLSKSNIVDLSVYNRTPKEEFKVFPNFTSSIQECVRDADVVFTMLSEPGAVREISSEFIPHLKPAAVWVDHSTVNPSFCRETEQLLSQSSIRYLEIPVAGSKTQAENGELAFFAGGSAESLEVIKPLLLTMGKSIHHAGAVGQGASIKMLINLLLAQSMTAFAEVLVLGSAMGLDTHFLATFLPKLPVSAPFLAFKAEKIKQNDFSPEFPLEWMSKDVRLALQTAQETGMELPSAKVCGYWYEEALGANLSREDFSALIKVIRKRRI